MRIAHCMVLAAGMALAGCGVQNLWRDGTDRFEEALPLPVAIAQAKAKLDTLVANDAAARDRLQREYDNRRALRALKCLLDKPSMFESAADIRKKVEPACLGAADEELRAWAQGARLRILLTLPALRPLPAEPPKFIATTDVPSVYGMADAAPILVVARDRKLEVLDAGNGQTLYRDAALPERPIFLAPSPNGRVFAAGESGSVVLRESATGEVLATHTGYRTFTWLDATTAILTDLNLNQRALFDGATGTLSQPKGMTTYTGTIVRVGTAPLQFIVPGFMKLAKFELSHASGPQIRIVEQRDGPKTGASNGNLLGTADGRHVVIADANSVIVADAVTLEAHSVETGRFNPLQACALEEPNAVLIKGNVREQWQRDYYYVYELGDDTFAPVEDERLMPTSGGASECPMRFNAFQAVYVKTQSGFRRLDDVKRGLRFHGGALEAHLTELFEAEAQRMQAVRNHEAMGVAGGSYAMSVGVPAKPALADIARDAGIQAVGVYEAENSSRGAGPAAQRWAGPVTVFVRPSDRPILLVLSSYEAVTWNLNVLPGARLKAILLGGYKTSTVAGAGNTRIVSIQGYAHEVDSAGYRTLDGEVMRWTGRRIDSFQGRYGGKTFTVGGR